MKTRLMTIADYESVYALWLSTPGMGLNTADDSREGVEKYLTRNPRTCFVAEENSRIVGAIMSGHDGRRGFIHHTAVLAQYQNKGIGSLLARQALKALEAEGIHKVALVAFARNENGNAFWEKLGFTVRDDLIYRNKSIHALERIDT